MIPQQKGPSMTDQQTPPAADQWVRVRPGPAGKFVPAGGTVNGAPLYPAGPFRFPVSPSDVDALIYHGPNRARRIEFAAQYAAKREALRIAAGVVPGIGIAYLPVIP